MLKSQIFNILRKYLGDYLYGFTKDQLEIGLLSGEFELVNVNFRPHKVNQMFFTQNLPFYLKSGMIGKLKVKYNYREWLSSPVEVYLEELLLIFGPVLITNSENPFDRTDTAQSCDYEFSRRSAFGDSIQMNRSSYLDESFRSMAPGIKIKSLEKLKESEAEGFIAKYFKTILTNLSLCVQNVHVRFEDETYAYRHPYSITLLLDRLDAQRSNVEFVFDESGEVVEKTVNNIAGTFAGQTSYTKQGKVENFALYVTSMSSMLIPTSLWEQTESSAIGIFSALPAYEIRNLMLDDAKGLKSSESTLLSPLSVRFSMSISSAAPFLRVTALSEQICLNLSNITAECVRNLLEYGQNARLWKEIRKYRPMQRVITTVREEDEPEYLRVLRREVVLSWFQYVFIFIRAKKQKPLFDDLGSPEFVEPEVTESVREAETQRSLFDISPQKVAGRAPDTLKSLIKAYNSAVTAEQLDKIKEKSEPLVTRPEHFFPKYVENSEIDFKAAGLHIHLFDNECKSSCQSLIKGIYLMLRVTSEELTSYLTVDTLTGDLLTENKRVTLVEMGKDSEDKVKAAQFLATYRPGENALMIGASPELNFVDIKARLDEVRLAYSHFTLSELLIIFESFNTDKMNRDVNDFEYMKSIEQKRSTLTWKEKFVKKNRQILHNATFKKVLMAKKLIRRLLQWQSQLKANVKSVDGMVKPFLFDVKVETAGVTVRFMDKRYEEKYVMSTPAGCVEMVKDKEYCKVDFFGFGLVIKKPFIKLYKYLIKITENMKKGIKRIRKATARISLIIPKAE